MDLGVTFGQVTTATRAILQSFQLTGASAQEATQSTRQLIQGLQSGVLRGEELNSVFESAPVIVNAIATQLGVSVGLVRELAAEGRITSDVVFSALLNNAEDINSAFGQTQITFSQLRTVVQAPVSYTHLTLPTNREV